jgi:hypothetical protein
MHHLTAEETAAVWSYDKQRGFDSEPMRIKNLFHQFMEPRLQDRRSDWDNLSSDMYYLNATAAEEVLAKEEKKEKLGPDELKFDKGDIDRSKGKNWHLSIDEEVAFVNVASCERACLTKPDCMQWKYKPGLCMLDKRASIGRPKIEREDKYKMTSGWMVDRIKEWAEKKECNGKVTWPKP